MRVRCNRCRFQFSEETMKTVQTLFALLIIVSGAHAQSPPWITYTLSPDQKSVRLDGTTSDNSQVSICITPIYSDGTECKSPQSHRGTVTPSDNHFTVGPIPLMGNQDLFFFASQGVQPIPPEIHLPAQNPLPICSTEIVNNSCTVRIDRSYPITLPTVQMKTGARLSVIVDNELPFESVTLDPQSQQAVAGTDQTAGLATALQSEVKNFVFSNNLTTNTNLALIVTDEQFSKTFSTAREQPTDTDKKIQGELTELQGMLQNVFKQLHTVRHEIEAVYLELQEASSPLPRPVDNSWSPIRPEGILSALPSPWSDYSNWRITILAQLNEGTSDMSALSKNWTLQAQSTVSPKPDCTTSPVNCEYPAFPVPSQHSFDSLAAATEADIQSLDPGDPAKTTFEDNLARLQNQKSQTVANLPNIASQISNTITAAQKDFIQYEVNIRFANGDSEQAELGSIYDPLFSANPSASSAHPRKSGVAPWSWNLMKFGRQAVFAVNVVNLIDNPVASVPTTQKKSIATITAVYADPIFEASAGAFFSWLPNRSFANQTQIVQGAECPDITYTGTPPTTSPVQCDVTITQTIKRPTVVPFAGANWRLGRDFPWWDGRRGAAYFTLGVGIDPTTTTTEYAGGFSLSWRSLMVSPLFHLGRDIHLTQGETVGEVVCNVSGQTNGTPPAPKCSGSPPAPTTTQFWRGAFAIGFSVRVPTTFGGGSPSSSPGGSPGSSTGGGNH
jgi:hypothetical protein